MKLLIVDRGYIDYEFINEVFYGAGSDILIPLKEGMDIHTYAILTVESPEWNGQWKCWKKETEYIEEVALVEHLGRWEGCKVDLYTSLMRKKDLKSGEIS
jgi:hypothetical protein